jgi:hypothetical protein
MSHTSTRAIAIAALIAATPLAMHAQIRRSTTPDGSTPAPGAGAPRGIPRSERHPYAGAWNGTFSLREDRAIPVVMVFDVADSAKSTYAGFTILPNNGRAPHLETSVTKGEIRWKQQNSGGGFWVYTGRFVTRDSIAGSVVLTDWPQLAAGEKPPSGTFSLARRAPGA